MYNPTDISKFFAIGINYKKTNAELRGQFAINSNGYELLLQLAPFYNLDCLFMLSTCNRTEIYGFAERPGHLIDLLCTQTSGSRETFERVAYIKNGADAIAHLFNVGAGLDSQILGDYEITGQLKQAIKFARERGFINCFLERLFNSVLQSSKSIKNETLLSGGTVSVSFAAIDFIRKHPGFTADARILLIGTGKIGRNACKNIVDYLQTRNITLVNRSEEKAIELANGLNLKYAPLSQLNKELEDADIILVASNAEQPVVLVSHLKDSGNKLIIDLSIPCNVEAAAGQLPNVTLVNVDTLSRINDETLKTRQAELPKARAIIAEQLNAFLEWYAMRKNAPALNAIKTKLHQLSAQQQSSAAETYQPCSMIQKKIQRVVNGAATKMRSQGQYGCQHIEALNEFIRIAI
jgi:glutamyl-tRNA reductase